MPSQIQDSAKIIPTDAKVTGDPIRFTLPQFVVDYNELLKITHSDDLLPSCFSNTNSLSKVVRILYTDRGSTTG